MSNKYTNQNLKDKILKNLSYTNRDYDNIIKEMIETLDIVDENRDWTNISSSDPFFLLLHLMAAHKDILNYQIDYSVLEGYMTTAKERASMVRIANSFGFKVPSYKAAYAKFKVKNTFEAKPFETQFIDTSEGVQIPWTYIGDTKTYKEDDEIELYQGIASNMIIDRDNIDSISNTKIVTNQQIAIGTSGPQQNASRILFGEIELTEVENVLYHNKHSDDTFTYHLAEDTLTTTYIQFNPNLKTDLLESKGLLYYLVTRGASVRGVNDMSEKIDGKTVEIEYITNSFIRGKDQATSSEIKEMFKDYYTGTDVLVTLRDYHNYILRTQTIIPNVSKVLVIDSESNSGQLTNLDIGIGGSTGVSIEPGKIYIYVLEEGNEEVSEDKLELLENHLKEKRMSLVTVKVKKDINKETIEVKIKGITTDDELVVNKITKIIKDLINEIPIGGYITVGDIYSEILREDTLAQTSRGIEVTIDGGNQRQLKYNEYGEAKIIFE